MEEGPSPIEALETIAPTATPEAAVATPAEPEVRRAEPVHPEDLVQPQVIFATPPSNRVQITPVHKTYLRVTVDNATQPAFDGWLDPSDPPLSFAAGG